MATNPLATFISTIVFNIDDSAIKEMRKKVKEATASMAGMAKQRAKQERASAQDFNKTWDSAYKEDSRRKKAEALRQEREEIRQLKRLEADRRRAQTLADRQSLIRIRQEGAERLAQIRHQNRLTELAARPTRTGAVFGGAAGLASRMAGPAIGGFGAFEVGRGVFEAGTMITGLQSAFRALTGSSEGAQKQISFINDEVDRLRLNLPSAAQDYKQLFASAQSRIGADATQELFRGLAETTVVFGLTADQQARAIRAISQIASKGKAMSEEVVGQWAEAVPGGVEMFAKAAKMSTEEFRDAMQDGKILAKDILPALAKVLREGVDPEALATALNSPLRKFEQMRTAYTRFLMKLGDAGVYDILTRLFEGISKALDEIAPSLNIVGSGLNTIFTAIRTGIGFVWSLVSGLKALGQEFPIMSSVLAASLIAVTPALRAFALTWVAIPLAIITVIGAIEDLQRAMDGKTSFFERWSKEDGFLGTMARWFLNLYDVIQLTAKAIVGLVGAATNAISGDFDAAGKSLDFIDEEANITMDRIIARGNPLGNLATIQQITPERIAQRRDELARMQARAADRALPNVGLAQPSTPLPPVVVNVGMDSNMKLQFEAMWDDKFGSQISNSLVSVSGVAGASR